MPSSVQTPDASPSTRSGISLIAATTLLLVAAVCWVDRDGARGDVVLGALAPVIEPLLDAGGLVFVLGGRALRVFRVPMLVVLVGLALWLAWRRRAEELHAGWLLVPLGLGWVAESFARDGRLSTGVLLYFVGAWLYVLRPPARWVPWGKGMRAHEFLLIVGLFAVFLAGALYGLDGHPGLHFDEVGYALAARMQAGEVPVARISSLYSYERYHGIWVPHVAQSLTVAALEPGIQAVRVASVAGAAAALIVATLTLRRRFGPTVAILTLSFAAVSPLFLAYARRGEHVAFSFLHATIVFAALLRLRARWDVRSAMWVGVALGASFYFYQLSWLVPIIAVIAFAVSPELWRRPRVVRVLGVVVLAAVATLSPFAGPLRDDLRAVSAQTFDKGVFREWAVGRRRASAGHVLLFEAPAPTSWEEVRRVERELGQRQITVHVLGNYVHVAGPEERVTRATELLIPASWQAVDVPRDTPQRRFVKVLRLLLFGRVAEGERARSSSVAASGLLSPILAPLWLLGILCSWRHRYDPAVRLLLVFVLGGAFLPTVLGGIMVRRLLLMLPFAYALMALSIAEVRRSGRRGGPATAAVLALMTAAVVGTNGYRYFRHWYDGYEPGRASILEIGRVVRDVPSSMPISIPRLDPLLARYLIAVEKRSAQGPEATIVLPSARPPAAAVRRHWKARATSFVWIAPNDPEQRALVRDLCNVRECREETVGAFVRVWVSRGG